MKLYAVLLIAGSVSFISFLLETAKGNSVRSTLKKAAASFFFIAVAAASAYEAGSYDDVLVPFVLMGLSMGLLGDIWLGLKSVFSEAAGIFMISGFISFGIEHIFFIIGMIFQFCKRGQSLLIILPILLSICASIAYTAMEKKMGFDYGKLKVAVTVYGSLLLSTVLISLFLMVSSGFKEPALIWIFIGSAFFAFSDVILSFIYFGNRRSGPLYSILNLSTYYLGQYLIALSLMFL